MTAKFDGATDQLALLVRIRILVHRAENSQINDKGLIRIGLRMASIFSKLDGLMRASISFAGIFGKYSPMSTRRFSPAVSCPNEQANLEVTIEVWL